VDANVLIYASDVSSPFHQRARSFLESCINGSEVFCIAWATILAYLRISTHPSIFRSPLSPESARRNVEQIIERRHVRLIREEDGFWDVWKTATRGLVLRGNLVPDAHLAALLLQHEVRTLFTNDGDFRRFTFLDVRSPFSVG
jgi:toxin-antitoxin system PIN domain toxin